MMDGSFSAPSYNSIGDPYVDSKENKVHSIKGTRQFLTTTSKKGQTGADWGPGPRKFVGVSGQYQEYYKEEAGYRLQNTKKNLNTKGFTYGNPTKKSGDFSGTFTQGYEYMPDGTYKARGVAKKFENTTKRNIVTGPSKKGSYGYGGTLLGGKERPYFSNGGEGKTKKKMAPKDDGKPSFKAVASKRDYFDGQDHCAASKVYARDEDCLAVSVDEEAKLTPKQIVEAKQIGENQWKPSHSGRSGNTATFNKFTAQLPDPYDERVVNLAMLPDRRNPVKDTCKHLSLAIQERRAFRPSSIAKTKFTRGTSLLGISKHSI